MITGSVVPDQPGGVGQLDGDELRDDGARRRHVLPAHPGPGRPLLRRLHRERRRQRQLGHPQRLTGHGRSLRRRQLGQHHPAERSGRRGRMSPPGSLQTQSLPE